MDVRTVAAVSLFTLVGCGGAGTGVPQAPLAQAIPSGASMTVAVPLVGASQAGLRPAYVSSATQSISIAVRPNGNAGTSLSLTQNLTPTSPGCSPVRNGFSCTIDLRLSPASYLATLSTYSGPGATGSQLSTAQNVAFTVTSGSVTPVKVTLNGVIGSISVTATSSTVLGSLAKGFAIYGTSPQTFTVAALDGSGETIVGAGAPTIALSSSNAAFTLTQPGAAGTFTVTPPVSGAVATITVNATAPGGAACVGTCSVRFPLQTATETVFVTSQNANTVTAYPVPLVGNAVVSIDARGGLNLPTRMAFDSKGDLFVGNFSGNTVTEYAPPYAADAPTATIGNGVNSPQWISVSNNNLFVDNQFTGTVTEYAAPYTGAPVTTIAGLATPVCLLFDGSQDLFVSELVTGTSSNVVEFAPPYTGAAINTFTGMGASAYSLALDTNRDLLSECCRAATSRCGRSHTCQPVCRCWLRTVSIKRKTWRSIRRRKISSAPTLETAR